MRLGELLYRQEQPKVLDWEVLNSSSKLLLKSLKI
jgi:hypothetical protein